MANTAVCESPANAPRILHSSKYNSALFLQCSRRVHLLSFAESAQSEGLLVPVSLLTHHEIQASYLSP